MRVSVGGGVGTTKKSREWERLLRKAKKGTIEHKLDAILKILCGAMDGLLE